MLVLGQRNAMSVKIMESHERESFDKFSRGLLTKEFTDKKNKYLCLEMNEFNQRRSQFCPFHILIFLVIFLYTDFIVYIPEKSR